MTAAKHEAMWEVVRVVGDLFLVLYLVAAAGGWK